MAASTLAAQHIGAIIVDRAPDRAAQLHRGRHSARRRLTYDLLVSIFQPTSPLHDGAVIVQDDRVAAAACFLPLTVNPR